MKKIVAFVVAVCVSGLGTVYAQSEVDAYKLSQRDNNGTARSLGMGGAFGALGGDVSSMSSNPAGLGVYRSSEIVGTVSLNMFNTNTNWGGSKFSENKTTFNLDNFAYVGYFPTGLDEGIVGWNVGFSYNRLMNFNRRYIQNGSQDYNITDYTAAISEGLTPGSLGDRDYRSNVPWMPALGYQAGFTIHESKNIYGPAFDDYAEEMDLYVKEWGGVDLYNFSIATNISNLFFVGLTVGVTDINYRMATEYSEYYAGEDHVYLDNRLSTDGTGVNFNLGVIARPTDYLRLGVAYNSPTWYNMTDYYHATAETFMKYSGNDPQTFDASTPSNSATDYKLRTPDRWVFSLAGVLGQSALISVDYELTNYKNTRLYDQDGHAATGENEDIRNRTQNMHTIKVGAEYKITPQFAVRAGGGWQSSYANSILQDNKEEIYTAGTVPHFTVDKGTASLSLGLGYRFTPNFYMDMAYVYKQRKENAYVFSNVYFKDGSSIDSKPADLKTNTSRIALTFGYKF